MIKFDFHIKNNNKKKRKSSKNAKQQNQNFQSTAGAQRPNKATLQAMIANLDENTSDSSSSSSDSGFKSTSSKSDSTNQTTSSNNQMNLNFSNSAKLFLEEDGFASDTNLGELSRISVNNSNLNTSGANDETIIDVCRCFDLNILY